MKDEKKEPRPKQILGTGCCGPDFSSETELMVDDEKVTVKGLEEVFEIYSERFGFENLKGERLATIVKEWVDIPKNKEDDFAKALEEEYRKYCEDKK